MDLTEQPTHTPKAPTASSIETVTWSLADAPTATLQFSLSPRRVAQAMTIVTIILTVLSVGTHAVQFLYGREAIFEIGRFLNLGDEKNLPTWYAAINLFISALLLAYIGRTHRRQNAADWRAWRNMALIFTFLSLDEVATIHDNLLEKPLIEWLDPSGFLAFPWVIVGALGVAAFLFGFRRFIRQLPADTRRRFFVAGGLFVTGALLLEMVSAYLMHYHLNAVLIRGLIATVQEFLEMFGIVVFVYALLAYIGEHLGQPGVEIANP